MKEFTTQEIANSLGVAIGIVRTTAFKLFQRNEVIFDADIKSFVFSEEQAEKIMSALKKDEPKQLLLGSDKPAFIAEKVMTTKELAEFLKVDVRTIQLTANKVLDPTKVHSRVINGGKSKVFTEEQATAIKMELEKHHNIKNRENIDAVSNDLEGALLVQKALNWQQTKISELQEQIAELRPDAVSWNTYAGNIEERNAEKSFRDVAKLLQIDPQKALTDFLIEKKYIYRDRNSGKLKASQTGLETGIVVSRAVNSENYSGEQCKVTTYGMKKLAEWKEQGAFDGKLIKKRA